VRLQRVAYVVKTFPKLSETFIAGEIAELRRRGIDARIGAIKRPAEDLQHEIVRRARLLDVTTWDLDEYRGLLSDFKPQLVHAHFATEPTRIARELSAELNVPFTFTAHGHDVYRKAPADFGERADAASAVITVSEANANHISARFGVRVEDIEVVPCGIDMVRFQPSRETAEGGLIVCVARFSPVKNVGLLLRACSLLARRQVNFRCVVIGDGRCREEIRQVRSDLGLERAVTLVGALAQDDVIRWWRRATVGALTSHSEGMPVSLMEAAACGVPVVATAVGGVPELVADGRTGFVVEPEHDEQLAAALERVICDGRLASRMRQAARERAVRKFSVVRQVDQLLAIWDRVFQAQEATLCASR